MEERRTNMARLAVDVQYIVRTIDQVNRHLAEMNGRQRKTEQTVHGHDIQIADAAKERTRIEDATVAAIAAIEKKIAGLPCPVHNNPAGKGSGDSVRMTTKQLLTTIIVTAFLSALLLSGSILIFGRELISSYVK